MNPGRWTRIGGAGSVITALCCFTPVLVVMLPLIGVGAWLTWIDWVLFPLLGIFLLLTIAGMLAARGKVQPDPGERESP